MTPTDKSRVGKQGSSLRGVLQNLQTVVGLFRGGSKIKSLWQNLKSHFTVTFSPYKAIHVTWAWANLPTILTPSK